MIDIERMSKYMGLLESKRYITASEFLSVMEISCATFKRDLAVLRDRFDVPIVYDRDFGAYKLEHNYNKKRLPGIWFDSQELQVIKFLEEQINTLGLNELSLEIEQLRAKLERACQ
jgi:predicted DNA-binding transcriptional regulator YafY